MPTRSSKGTGLPLQPELLTDADFASWTQISTDFGTKIIWGDGKNGTTKEFVGVFTGLNIIPIGEPDDDGNTVDSMSALEFVDANGEKFYSWQNFALEQALDKGDIVDGDTVRIVFTGEVPTKRGLNKVKKLAIQVKPRQ